MCKKCLAFTGTSRWDDFEGGVSWFLLQRDVQETEGTDQPQLMFSCTMGHYCLTLQSQLLPVSRTRRVFVILRLLCLFCRQDCVLRWSTGESDAVHGSLHVVYRLGCVPWHASSSENGGREGRKRGVAYLFWEPLLATDERMGIWSEAVECLECTVQQAC